MEKWFANTAGLRARLLKGGLGIIFLMGLLSFGTGVYFWGKVDSAIEVRNTISRVLIQRSLARNAERDLRSSELTAEEFYRNERTKNLDKYQEAMAAMDKEIWNLMKLLPSENEERLKALSDLAHKYQKNFLELVTAYRQRGFKTWGFEGAWRLAMSEVEGYVERTQNVFAVRALLDLMRDEKDYLLQNDDSYAHAIYEDLKELKRMILAHDRIASTTLLEALAKYEVAFTDYISIQHKIGLTEEVGLQGEMQRAAKAMEPIIRDIQVMSIQAGDNARQNFITVISIIWVLGLVGGGTFFYFHAGSIANPIIQLKDAALKIGQGELTTRITLDSKDEVGVLARAFNQMAAGLSQAQETLRESESHSRLIIETAHDAFVAIDVQGMIIDWNRQAENLFGWSREEIIGRRFDDMIATPQTHEAHIEGYQHFLLTGEGLVLDQRIEVMATHQQGRQFPVEMTVWPIQLGETYRFNAFIHDISERKQAEQMKSDFVSFVTHQLRTPLAGIRWLLELASEEDAIPAEPLSYIQDARESADRLIRLVNDLLDISRLERGKFAIAPEEVKLGELTHSVLSEVNLLVQEKGHQLHCLLTDEIPSVLVDRQLIRQVVLNLVSNAIKYTPTAGDICVRLCQVGSTVQVNDIATEALRMLPEKYARAHALIPFAAKGRQLHLAMWNPRDHRLIAEVEQLSGRQPIPYLAPEMAIQRALLLYKGNLREMLERAVVNETSTVSMPRRPGNEDPSAVQLLNQIVEYAAVARASDIHVEPYELEGLIRYRIDGALQEVLSLPPAMLVPLVARIKILAGVRIDERRAPQDGRFEADLGGFKIDLRVSSLATHWGEKVVLRVLSKENVIVDLEDLGLGSSDYDIVHRNLLRPSGMILITGPTGSGKTTSLYAMVMRVGIERQNVVNISTIEDPVEYTMPRVNQVQVNPSAGVEFATGLRALLRQDPDIIMVGEIRDRETAEIAVRSALVGRLLLSTLHTNDATGAVSRLLDMQVEPFLLASTLALVVAQRLVRRICPNCRESLTPDPSVLKALCSRPDFDRTVDVLRAQGVLGRGDDPLSGIRLFRGKGCAQCHGSGFRGRLGLFELFEIDDHIRSMIMERQDNSAIRGEAIARGMKTMFQDGLAKVFVGETTLEEVFRIAV